VNAVSTERTVSLLLVKSVRIWSVAPIDATATRSAGVIVSSTHLIAASAAR